MFILIRLIKRSSVSLGRSLGYSAGGSNFCKFRSFALAAN